MLSKKQVSRRSFFGISGLAIATVAAIMAQPQTAYATPEIPVAPNTELAYLSGTNEDASAAITAWLATQPSQTTLSGDYFMDSEVIIPYSVTQLTLAAGTKLKQRGSHNGLRRVGKITYRETLNEPIPADSNTITIVDPSKYTTGEWINISSEDVIPNSDNIYGYLRQIIAIDNNIITLDKAVPRGFTKTPKTGSVEFAPSLRITGSGEIFHTNPTDNKSSLVNFSVVDNPICDGINIHHNGGAGVGVSNSLNGKIDATISDLIDSESKGYFGYGVNVSGATRGLVVYGTISRVRHAVTTNIGPVIEGLGAVGEPEDCWFEPTAINCSNKSVDTHRPGWNTTIVPHVTGGGGGVQVRADNTHIIGGEIKGSAGPGISVNEVVTTAATAEGTAISLLVYPGVPVRLKGPGIMKNLDIKDSYGAAYELYDNSQVIGGIIGSGISTGVKFLGKNSSVTGIQLASTVKTPYTGVLEANGNSFSTSTESKPLDAPKCLIMPIITGTLTVNQTLTVNSGSWDRNSLTFTYQWNRDNTPIAGATNMTYVVTNDDAGKNITATVTTSRQGYANGVATTTPSLIPSKGLSILTQPTILGVPKIGSKLSTTRGTWNMYPTTVKTTWALDGKTIPGATGSTLIVASSYVGKKITATITGIRTGYDNGTATTQPVTILGNLLTALVQPQLTGDPIIKNTIKVSSTKWNSYPTTSKTVWNLNGTPIVGATGSTLVLKSNWVGQKITATVTATKTNYETGTIITEPVVVQGGKLAIKTGIAITGEPIAKKTVKVSQGSWNVTPDNVKTTWNLNGVPIVGATGSTLVLKAIWVGQKITATVTATKANYETGTFTTNPINVK
jgi:hypothetical protein